MGEDQITRMRLGEDRRQSLLRRKGDAPDFGDRLASPQHQAVETPHETRLEDIAPGETDGIVDHRDEATEGRIGRHVLDPEIGVEELLDPGERILSSARFHDRYIFSEEMAMNSIGNVPE